MMQQAGSQLPQFGPLPDGVSAGVVALSASGDEAGFLPPEEEASAARLKTPALQAARRAVLAARRAQLAEWTQVPAQRLVLERTGNGAPVLAYPAGWTLSFSDTDGAAAIAAARGPCALGIDIVRAAPRAWAPMLSMVCAPDEAAAFLARFGETGGAPAFHRLWAIKEAALKATGRGMRAGAQTVRVRMDWLEGPGPFGLSLSGQVLQGVSIESGGVFACLVAGPVIRRG